MMFDFDGFQSSHPVEDSMFGNKISNNVAPTGKARAATPSEKYAVEITEIAVKNVSDPVSRHLMKLAILPTVEVNVAIGHSSVRKSQQTVKSDWARFVTSLHTTVLPMVHLAPITGVVNTMHLDTVPRKISEPQILNFYDATPEIAEEVEKDVQRESVQGEFVVTRELMSSWVDCLNAIRAEAKEPPVSLDAALQDKQYSNGLLRQLNKVISNFGIRKSYEGGRYMVTLGQKLYPTLAGLIVDHLMLPPEEGAVFLATLKKQLYEQSAKGPVFHGEWGKLIIDDANELVFVLEKRRKQKLSKLLKAFD